MEKYWKKNKGKENIQDQPAVKTKTNFHGEGKGPLHQKLTLLEPESVETETHREDQLRVDECPPPHHVHH
jgi:hypothetical protein